MSDRHIEARVKMLELCLLKTMSSILRSLLKNKKNVTNGALSKLFCSLHDKLVALLTFLNMF